MWAPYSKVDNLKKVDFATSGRCQGQADNAVLLETEFPEVFPELR